MDMDFLQRLVQAEGGPVRTVGGHRLYNIGHSEDSRLQEDVLPPETFRISRAVHLFVMLVHDLGDWPGKFYFFQNMVAGTGWNLIIPNSKSCSS